MRIAIVTNTAWNILNFRLPLVNVLRQDGHEVFAFCPEGDEVEAIRGAGIDWRPIKNLQRRGRNPLRDLLLGYELARLYRSEKISVALHYTIKPVIFGSIAANLSGVKIINTITGLGYTFVNLSFTQELVKLLYQLALGLADHTLFHNKDDLALFLKEGLVKRRPVGIVPGSGLDLNYFGYVPLKKEDKYRVLFIGRFLKDKGISEYADAARILKVEQKQSIEFLLLGSIDEGNPAAISTETLEHWLTTGLFEYLGQRTDVRSAIASAALVVLPSYREGLPRVLLEAGAIGRPVVASDVPGCRSVVEHGVTGWLVPPGDAAALAEAVRHALDLPPETLALMGQRGRQRVEQQFSVERVTSIYRGLLARLEE